MQHGRLSVVAQCIYYYFNGKRTNEKKKKNESKF